MATTVDQLITRYTLIDNYTTPAHRIAVSTDTLGQKISKVTRLVVGLNAVLGTMAVGGFAAFSQSAIETALRFERLRLGMLAVTGSTEEMSKQWKRLKELARLPGLGFEEVVHGSIKLQNAGLSAERAETAIRAFGNALALAGGTKTDLGFVLKALTQIQAKGKIAGEEINQQIAEHVPQIHRALIAAFGTADTELLQQAGVTVDQFFDKVTAQLLKLPQMTDSIPALFENIGDAWSRLLDAFGKGWFAVARKLLAVVTPFMDFLEISGIMNLIGTNFANLVNGIVGGGKGLARVFSVITAFALELPGILKNAWASAGKGVDLFFKWGDALVKQFGEVYNYLGEKGTDLYNIIGQAMHDMKVFFYDAMASLQAFGEIAKTVLGSIVSMAVAVFKVIAPLAGALLGGVTSALGSISDAMGQKIAEIRKNMETHANIDPFEKKTFKPFKFGFDRSSFDPIKNAFNGLLGGSVDKVMKRADVIQDAFGAFKQPALKPFLGGAEDGTAMALGEIADNTGRTVALMEKDLDFKRVMMGGGPLGQMGVTPVELFAGTGRRGSTSVRVKFDRDGQVSDAMETVVNDVIGQMLRNGQLQVGR